MKKIIIDSRERNKKQRNFPSVFSKNFAKSKTERNKKQKRVLKARIRIEF